MKKLQVLTLSIILSSSFITQATLVNGFSDIQASNPRNKDARTKASDSRIAEEMGKPVTKKSFLDFVNLTKNYIQSIKPTKNPSRSQLEIAVKAVIDIFRASKQLDKNSSSTDLKNQIDQIKTNLLQLNLPPQLKNMLENSIE